MNRIGGLSMTATLRESLTTVERMKVEFLKDKMNNAQSKAAVLYYEWRIHVLLNKAERRMNQK